MRLHLIPQVKSLQLTGGFLRKKSLRVSPEGMDGRLLSALRKLPCDKTGIPVSLEISGQNGEGYSLTVREDAVTIRGDSPAGAFYAIQTLRQLFHEEQVPCLEIADGPDFPHRGFYHDVSRGRVPTVASMKALIDDMAYFKLNSLQLYVEHVFPFEETKELAAKSGCLTPEELREIGAYCRENFIDFIPSLSTFGHMYDILEQPRYRHLRVRRNHEAGPNFWRERMDHHTIDPLLPESLELVKHLIDQYIPCFDSEWFNICCDETFDLQEYGQQGLDEGQIYVEFVQKIIDHVVSRGKKVMMWADILLEHPQVIASLPESTVFLNWYYHPDPEQMEQKVAKLAASPCAQMVCPGNWSWHRLCENVTDGSINITGMINAGFRHGAQGVLNTNWGDWGHPCSLALGMYGMVLGAAKSWAVETAVDGAYDRAVGALLYGADTGVVALRKLSLLHEKTDWKQFSRNYWENQRLYPDAATVEAVQQGYLALRETLTAEVWEKDEYRREMLLAAEGICLMAELSARKAGNRVERLTDTRRWLEKYRTMWLQNNKESELCNIEALFLGSE